MLLRKFELRVEPSPLSPHFACLGDCVEVVEPRPLLAVGEWHNVPQHAVVVAHRAGEDEEVPDRV